MSNHPNFFKYDLRKYSPNEFEYSEKELLEAVSENIESFRYIPKKPHNVIINVLNRYGPYIFHVKQRSKDYGLIAVQQNPYSIKFIEPEIQTEEICKIAASQRGDMLCFCAYRTLDICRLAVQQDGWAILHVSEEFFDELYPIAVKTSPEIEGRVSKSSLLGW